MSFKLWQRCRTRPQICGTISRRRRTKRKTTWSGRPHAGEGGVGGGDAQHMVWLPHSTFSGRHAAQCLGATQHIVCFLGGQYHSSAVMAMAKIMYLVYLEHLKYLCSF